MFPASDKLKHRRISTYKLSRMHHPKVDSKELERFFLDCVDAVKAQKYQKRKEFLGNPHHPHL